MKQYLLAALLSLSFACLAAGSVMAGNMFTPESGYTKTGGLGDLFGGSGNQRSKSADNQHPIRDEKTFEELTTVHTVMPFERADLYFTINIPKDWSTDLLPEGKKDISTSIIGDIARFSSPMIGIKRLRVSIHALNIEHEIAVPHWLRHYILANGFAPEGEVITDPQNPRKASIYFVGLEDGDSFYNYMTAQLSGNIMVITRFQSPQSLREYAKFLQQKTVESFSLTYPKEGTIENHNVFTMMDAAKLSYPKSWEMLGQSFRDMNRLSLQLHNKNATGGIDGFIMINAIRRHRVTSLIKEIDELKKYLDTQMEISVTDMLSSEHAPAADRFIFNRYEVYNVESTRRSQSKQDLHLVVLGDREWYILIFMMTMREEERLYAWARNVKTLEEIVRSIR
ncbi:MAG: hypothetical protein ACK4PK_01865 [Alphaproteobacteria bacterium]